MTMVDFNNVSKKFRKGEKFNSLRDAIPNLFRKLSAPQSNNYLKDKEFWALKNVTFSVKKGEVLGIIGANGAGKSTTLKLLSRIMSPTEGKIRIKGRLSALIEVTAGFHPELTGRENVYLNGTILGMKRKEIDRKFDAIVEFSGIKEFIDTPVKRYSTGMYSRLGFSVAAHMDSDVLLVDEVLAVGDISFQAKCSQKMRELLASGTTIVLISHNLSLVQSLCKRVILINKGQVQKEGTPCEVIPYYENIVLDQAEEELRKQVNGWDHKVKVAANASMNIRHVSFGNTKVSNNEDLNMENPFFIQVEYDTSKRIENPVFCVDVIRADGVLCCCINSKQEGFLIEAIEGAGSVRLQIDDARLAPGIYLLKISIWDKEMLYPYAIRQRDLLKIQTHKISENMNAVFVPRVSWTVKKEKRSTIPTLVIT